VIIVALISLLVNLEPSAAIGNMTTTAEQKAESLVNQGRQKINGAGAMARSGFQRVSYAGLNSVSVNGRANRPGAPETRLRGRARIPPPTRRRVPIAPRPASPGNRDASRKRPNRSER